jgi:WD40 repeat protein
MITGIQLNIYFGVFWVFAFVTSPAIQTQTPCPENAQYWERWQENAELRSRMTGSVWNVTSFDISPDGETLAVANTNSLTLYDVQTLSPTVDLESAGLVENGSYRAVKWSPDGKRIAAAYSVHAPPSAPNPASGIQIWDVEQAQQLALLSGNADPKVIDWSPVSSILAEGEIFGDIQLWDTDRGIASNLYEREPFAGFISGILMWSPDGQYLAAAPEPEGALRLYTLGDDEPQLFESPERAITYLAWSPSSDQFATSSWAGLNIYIFDIGTGEIVRTLSYDQGNTLDIQWSPDGAWMARGIQRGVYLWDMTSEATAPVRAFDEQMPPFVRMAWLPDSQHLISVDFEGSLYRWDVETGCVEAAVLNEWRLG